MKALLPQQTKYNSPNRRCEWVRRSSGSRTTTTHPTVNTDEWREAVEVEQPQFTQPYIRMSEENSGSRTTTIHPTVNTDEWEEVVEVEQPQLTQP